MIQQNKIKIKITIIKTIGTILALKVIIKLTFSNKFNGW